MSDTPAIISHSDIHEFIVKYNDGTERRIPCQQVWLDAPYVTFWRINQERSAEAFLIALSAASIQAITPVYREGSRSAALIGQEPAPPTADPEVRDPSAWCCTPNPDGPLMCGRLAHHTGPHQRGERTWPNDTEQETTP